MSSDPDDLADEASTEGDRDNAAAPHTADRPPTPEEEAAAEQLEPDPSMAEHFSEMNKIGAEVEGEGEIGS